MTNEKDIRELPENTTLRLCRCGILLVGANACPHCGAGWAEAQSPLTTYTRTERKYFCSCGGALTAEEYIEHYFEKGHDHRLEVRK